MTRIDEPIQSPTAAGDEPRWAKDFPINTAEDNYVARRDFTKFMVLTSLALLVGQVCIGIGSLFSRWRRKPAQRPIAKVSQIAVGSTITFAFPGENDPCLLIRRGENEFVAYSQKCTHLSCAVVPRMAEGRLACPCHEGSFDLASGRALAGPPRRPLPRVTLEVRDGNVYATGLEVSTV
jgi:nitrite reductase/ring-hydroxylating ferredoxin subunit